MISILSIAIVALLCVIAGHLVFLKLVRPVVMQRLQYRIFALRDELRMLAVKNELAEGSAAGYSLIESRLNAAANAVWNIDLAELMYVQVDRESELEFSRFLEIVEDGDPRLLKIYRVCIKVLVSAVMLNSPILLAIVPTAMLLEHSIGYASRVSDYFRQRAWEAAGEPQFATC